MVESNRDVLTLQQDLPQIKAEEGGVTQANVENRFNRDDKIILSNYGLIKPSELMGMTEANVKTIQEESVKRRNEISRKIAGLKKTMTALEKKDAEIPQKINNDLESFTRERKTLSTYVSTINDVLSLRKYYMQPKTGSGIRKYKQPKRNAYKIQNSSYGNLSIDVPKLMNEMKLNAIRGGKIIYQANADKSTIDLLTKRFNSKKKYSMNAVKILNDLNMLANLPKHKSSGKSRFVGSGVVFYQDPKELADRMKVLIGSMAAGKNSPVLKNDLSLINDELLKIGAIDKTLHEKLYDKYLK